MRATPSSARAPRPDRRGARGANPRALRLVVVVALDCRSVAECLGLAPLATPLWPSTLYAWLAETAATSPAVWDRCARELDRSLARWLPAYGDAAPAAIAEALVARDGTCMGGEEVAAALWALVRRRDRSLDLLLDRLTCEAEVLVARTCLRS